MIFSNHRHWLKVKLNMAHPLSSCFWALLLLTSVFFVSSIPVNKTYPPDNPDDSLPVPVQELHHSYEDVYTDGANSVIHAVHLRESYEEDSSSNVPGELPKYRKELTTQDPVLHPSWVGDPDQTALEYSTSYGLDQADQPFHSPTERYSTSFVSTPYGYLQEPPPYDATFEPTTYTTTRVTTSILYPYYSRSPREREQHVNDRPYGSVPESSSSMPLIYLPTYTEPNSVTSEVPLTTLYPNTYESSTNADYGNFESYQDSSELYQSDPTERDSYGTDETPDYDTSETPYFEIRSSDEPEYPDSTKNSERQPEEITTVQTVYKSRKPHSYSGYHPTAPEYDSSSHDRYYQSDGPYSYHDPSAHYKTNGRPRGQPSDKEHDDDIPYEVPRRGYRNHHSRDYESGYYKHESRPIRYSSRHHYRRRHRNRHSYPDDRYTSEGDSYEGSYNSNDNRYNNYGSYRDNYDRDYKNRYRDRTQPYDGGRDAYQDNPKPTYDPNYSDEYKSSSYTTPSYYDSFTPLDNTYDANSPDTYGSSSYPDGSYSEEYPYEDNNRPSDIYDSDPNMNPDYNTESNPGQYNNNYASTIYPTDTPYYNSPGTYRNRDYEPSYNNGPSQHRNRDYPPESYNSYDNAGNNRYYNPSSDIDDYSTILTYNSYDNRDFLSYDYDKNPRYYTPEYNPSQYISLTVASTIYPTYGPNYNSPAPYHDRGYMPSYSNNEPSQYKNRNYPPERYNNYNPSPNSYRYNEDNDYSTIPTYNGYNNRNYPPHGYGSDPNSPRYYKPESNPSQYISLAKASTVYPAYSPDYDSPAPYPDSDHAADYNNNEPSQYKQREYPPNRHGNTGINRYYNPSPGSYRFEDNYSTIPTYNRYNPNYDSPPQYTNRGNNPNYNREPSQSSNINYFPSNYGTDVVPADNDPYQYDNRQYSSTDSSYEGYDSYTSSSNAPSYSFHSPRPGSYGSSYDNPYSSSSVYSTPYNSMPSPGSGNYYPLLFRNQGYPNPGYNSEDYRNPRYNSRDYSNPVYDSDGYSNSGYNSRRYRDLGYNTPYTSQYDGRDYNTPYAVPEPYTDPKYNRNYSPPDAKYNLYESSPSRPYMEHSSPENTYGYGNRGYYAPNTNPNRNNDAQFNPYDQSSDSPMYSYAPGTGFVPHYPHNPNYENFGTIGSYSDNDQYGDSSGGEYYATPIVPQYGYISAKSLADCLNKHIQPSGYNTDPPYTYGSLVLANVMGQEYADAESKTNLEVLPDFTILLNDNEDLIVPPKNSGELRVLSFPTTVPSYSTPVMPYYPEPMNPFYTTPFDPYYQTPTDPYPRPPMELYYTTPIAPYYSTPMFPYYSTPQPSVLINPFIQIALPVPNPIPVYVPVPVPAFNPGYVMPPASVYQQSPMFVPPRRPPFRPIQQPRMPFQPQMRPMGPKPPLYTDIPVMTPLPEPYPPVGTITPSMDFFDHTPDSIYMPISTQFPMTFAPEEYTPMLIYSTPMPIYTPIPSLFTSIMPPPATRDGDIQYAVIYGPVFAKNVHVYQDGVSDSPDSNLFSYSTPESFVNDYPVHELDENNPYHEVPFGQSTPPFTIIRLPRNTYQDSGIMPFSTPGHYHGLDEDYPRVPLGRTPYPSFLRRPPHLPNQHEGPGYANSYPQSPSSQSSPPYFLVRLAPSVDQYEEPMAQTKSDAPDLLQDDTDQYYKAVRMVQQHYSSKNEGSQNKGKPVYYVQLVPASAIKSTETSTAGVPKQYNQKEMVSQFVPSHDVYTNIATGMHDKPFLNMVRFGHHYFHQIQTGNDGSSLLQLSELPIKHHDPSSFFNQMNKAYKNRNQQKVLPNLGHVGVPQLPNLRNSQNSRYQQREDPMGSYSNNRQRQPIGYSKPNYSRNNVKNNDYGNGNRYYRRSLRH